MADIYVKPTGNDTTGTGAVGAPYASPGKVLGIAGVSDRIFVETANYVLSTATYNVAGGCLNFNSTGTRTAFKQMIGHAVGDITTPARFTLTLAAGLAANVLKFNNANSYNEISNVNIVGNATSGASPIQGDGRSNRIRNCRISGFTGGGAHLVTLANNISFEDAEISGGSTGSFAALAIQGACVVSEVIVKNNAGRGVDVSSTGSIVLNQVKSHGHTGTNGYGFYFQGSCDYRMQGCAAYANAKSNVYLANTSATLTCVNCICGESAEYDWDNRSDANAIVLVKCAAKTSTSGLYPVTPTRVATLITLTVEPFANRANGDFSLNSAAGGGALLKANLRSLFTGQTNEYGDIGAVQSASSGGGLRRINFDGGF